MFGIIVEMMVFDMAVIMVVDMYVGKIVEEVVFHKHILTKLENIGFGFAEEAKPTKAQEYSINSKQDIDNFEEIV